MIRSVEESPLYLMANARSIAFFGASNNSIRMGSIILSSLEGTGYKGPIYPIHPTEKEIRGRKVYTNVLNLPEIPDLAIIVLPTDIVCQTMEECGRKGIRHAIVISGGFREAGPAGRQRQKELEAIARHYGIRFLGPNCIGIANLHDKLNTTPSTPEGKPGFVGIASQSGSFVTQMFHYLHHHGLGFSTAFSVGNEANIDLVDCMEYLNACPHTKVITLYVEGIARGQAFIETARAITPHKPIVAYYVGGSEAGKRAGFSHTGSLAGSDEIYDGVFRQCGIIRAHTITELFDYALALGTMPEPRGNRIIIQTHSGGPGATAADACGRVGLELPPLSQETVEKLQPLVPQTASTANPLDMTFITDQLDYFKNVPDILLQDKNADVLMVYFLAANLLIERTLRNTPMHPELIAKEAKRITTEYIDAFFRITQIHGKPVVGFTFRSLQEDMTRDLLERGIPIYPEPKRAARALAAVIRYYQMRNG